MVIIDYNKKHNLHIIGFPPDLIAHFIELLNENCKELKSADLINNNKYYRAILESAYLQIPLHLLGM